MGAVLQLPLESAPCYYRTSATVYSCRTITTQRPNWMTRWADGVGPDIVTLDRCGVIRFDSEAVWPFMKVFMQLSED
jgi:hypothetical protein